MKRIDGQDLIASNYLTRFWGEKVRAKCGIIHCRQFIFGVKEVKTEKNEKNGQNML